MMRQINLKAWPRGEHFSFYNAMGYPHFNMCTNLDLTEFSPPLKARGIKFTVAFVYVLARAANEIPEFRYRIRGESVVEHDVVHPSTTILTEDERFSFCTMQYTDDFSVFTTRATEQIEYVLRHPHIKDEPGEDNLLYMTAIPWVSFTGFMHPIDFPVDSIPRFAWGKFFQDGQNLKMPLSVQGHHALMDGLHMGRYYEKVQDYLRQPNLFIDRA
jgi:chloramphenicol O-acetyltransferase type A